MATIEVERPNWEVMAAVVQCLKTRGVNATFEYPGWICIPHGGYFWAIGTANDDWGGDPQDEYGNVIIEEPDGFAVGFTLEHSVGRTDAPGLADDIIRAISHDAIVERRKAFRIKPTTTDPVRP